MQCRTCSEWIHLNCSLLSLSKVRTLGSFHFWSCPPCCVPTRNTVNSSSTSSGLYTSTVQSGPLLLMLHSRSTLAFKPPVLLLPILYLLHLLHHQRFLPLAVVLRVLLPLPPDSLRVLQSNTGGLRDRSTELLDYLSSHLVDFICIQESNLYSSSFFQISGFSTLQSDRTHSWPGILSCDITHASGGVIIFVRQDLSFLNFLSSLFLRLTPTLIM